MRDEAFDTWYMVNARLTRHMEDDAQTRRFRRCNLTNFPIAKDTKSWHVRSSSYERTPNLVDFKNKSLSGQHQPITRLSCYRASFRSR